MNGLEKPFRKNPIQKIEKTVKIKVKLPHVNKKPLANFCSNTVFSLYFKFRAKKFHAAKPLAFSLHFLFRRDQNHYSNLTSKIMKMCEQILKKNIAGQVLTYNSKNFHWLNRKLDLEQTMNGLEKPFRRKSDPKNRKNSKNQIEIAACEQETTNDKANFCSNTVLSLYFKIRAKKIHATEPLAFSLHFLFRRDQNHYSNLTSKIMKMCEQILKKKT